MNSIFWKFGREERNAGESVLELSQTEGWSGRGGGGFWRIEAVALLLNEAAHAWRNVALGDHGTPKRVRKRVIKRKWRGTRPNNNTE